MKREILLARTSSESRGAVITDGALSDYRLARPEAPSLVGGICRARVKKSMPGLAGAIVEIPGGEVWLDLARAQGAKFQEGGVVTLQIAQDPPAGKLARATLAPMIAGRFLAFQPRATKSALSHRIADNDARAHLGALLGKLAGKGRGQFLALHRAPEASDAVLAAEAERLHAQWRAAEFVLDAGAVPSEVLAPPDPTFDLLRLFVDRSVARIAVDSEALAAAVRDWLAVHAPEWKGAVEREPVGRAALDGAELRAALDDALAPEVALPGGGALVIESAAGITVIDVDTDRAIASSAKANFARVNREAAREIARQIRLRNLGGRIVVDFAGLGAARELPAALGVLRSAVGDDPMGVQIAAPSELGLVEMIRRRERRTLAEMLAPH